METSSYNFVVNSNEHATYDRSTKPLHFPGGGEWSLTDAIGLSKIRRVTSGPKAKKRREATKIRFVPEDKNETHEMEPCMGNLKETIWYNAVDFGAMVENLDDITRQRRKHIQGVRKYYVRTILDLQEEHRTEGIVDPKGIACMAKRCTKYSSRDAVARGKEMEKEAKRVDRTQTLNILDSVLDMLDDSSQHKRGQDTCLQPPRRLVSPASVSPKKPTISSIDRKIEAPSCA